MPCLVRLFAIVAFIALPLVSPAQDSAGGPSLAEVLQRDAKLHDLSMVDGRHGWAVGDRGTVWRTTDGGRRWHLLETPIDCPLYAASFVDHLHGWVVGGTVRPYTHSAHAVVLRTEDGGDTWRQMPVETLPLLRRVQFFNHKLGVAVGAGTSFAPSGVFVTNDAGRSWRPLLGDRPSHWQAAHFITPKVGLVSGAQGTLAKINGRELERSSALQGDRRGINSLRLTTPTTGWMVGDGGLVLATTDGGRTWQPPAGKLPPATEQLCDWQSITTAGANVWIAGAPGSVVLHSPDAGRTWQLQPTGITAPLTTIHFADERRGWVAGALGTILSTDDAGRTWRVQRRGGGRTSIAMFTPEISQTPLDLIASLAAAEGHFMAVDAPLASETAEDSAAAEIRLAEAAVQSGAALSQTGWRLAIRPEEKSLSTESLLAALNRRTDGQAMAELEKQLVTRIRTLRPELVLLVNEAGGSESQTPATQLLNRAVASAVEIARDPGQYAELAASGLSPHKVRRVAIVRAVEPRTSPRISTGDFQPLLATSPAQWVGPARGLIQDTYTPPPAAIGWRVVAGEPLLSTTARDPMAGIAIPRGGDARRAPALPPAGELDALRSIAQKRRNMQSLLASAAGDSKWAGQVVNLTSGLDADSGAELLYQLADSYRTAGRRDMAADTFYLLARRYTDHPLADSALVWLLRYYCSGEVATAMQATGTGSNIRVQHQTLSNVTQPGRETIKQAGLSEPATTQGTLTREERLERAAQLGSYLEQARPALFADPAIRFPMAAAERARGNTAAAEKYLTVLANQAIDPAWKRCAETERSFVQSRSRQRSAIPSKPVTNLRLTEQRPLLDGKLDEPCWQQAEKLVLQGERNTVAPDAGPTVRLARDAEFLYVAIDCPKRPGLAYDTQEGASKAPRTRDTDLKSQDRISLHVDTDRDYTTALELTIDARGWTGDRCWSDPHWNPTWYVAAGQSTGRWTAEAAIPLRMLTPENLPPGATWAVSITRQTPGERPQSWTGATDERSPDRFGLVGF